MSLFLAAASKLVPNESFPWDKTLENTSYLTNIITGVVIVLFIAFMVWIIRLAFDKKKE